MNDTLRTVLSLSLSGAIPGVLLLLARPLYRDRLSRRWQYYVWLVVLARLLLPFAPEASPVGTLFQPAAPELTSTVEPSPGGYAALIPRSGGEPAADTTAAPSQPAASYAQQTGLDTAVLLDNLWLIWLGGTLILLVRKATIYQNFVRYVKAGRREVSNTALLDQLAEAGERAGVRRPVELYENGLISSPLLLGFFRPCIVLPSADLPEEDFRCTVLHELIHYRRRDMAYKWLAQLAVCVHWFNPLVWLMVREISRACELSCDEAVLEILGPEERRAYGGTLLRALEAGGGYRNSVASVTLHESAALLKERLASIMNFRRVSNMTNLLSLALAAVMALGAAMAGAYVGLETEPQAESYTQTESVAQLERYYESGSLPLFQLEAAKLDEAGRSAWAEKIYSDGAISFFSILANYMGEEELESWLNRALEDGAFAFQSMLYGRLDRYDEWSGAKDAIEEELAAQQMAEYAKYGVDWDGEDYYYQGQLVNIFLDCRQNSSFVTLDMEPRGTVNVKIVRDANNQILRAEELSGEELTALMEDLYGPDSNDFGETEMGTITINGTTYYQVENEAQLRAIACGKYGMDKNFMQKNDIQLSSEEWIPIGSREQPFTGSFNGNGFEIRGLTMTDPNAKLAGLFGEARGAKIYNITLRDIDITTAGRDAANHSAGAVVALALEGTQSFDNFVYSGERGTASPGPIQFDTVKSGEAIWLGEYTLSEGDRIQYNFFAEAGDRMQVFFAKDGRQDAVYWSVNNRRQRGEPLHCSLDTTLHQPPAEPGTYQMYLKAPDGALSNVSGSIRVTKDGEALNLSREDLPEAVQRALDSCDIRGWYVVPYEDRQYISCKGFAWSFGYQPARTDSGWTLKIVTFQKTDYGDLLLAVPAGEALTITVDGEAVAYTVLEA